MASSIALERIGADYKTCTADSIESGGQVGTAGITLRDQDGQGGQVIIDVRGGPESIGRRPGTTKVS
jgi:hypothetical protein